MQLVSKGTAVIQVCRNLNFICFLTCKLTFNDVTDLNGVTGQLSAALRCRTFGFSSF